MFRRKPPGPILYAFLRMAEELDVAQRALLAAIPTSRDPGVPLHAAIDAFLRKLDDTAALMPAWLSPEISEIHERCAHAIVVARDEARALRAEATALAFEPLNARVGDVLHPLEIFSDTEQTLRRNDRSRPKAAP